MNGNRRVNYAPVSFGKKKMNTLTELDMQSQGSPKFISRKIGTLLGLLMFLFASLTAHADQNVMFGWNPSTNNVAGYYVHYGNASHHYGGTLDVGTNTVAAFSNLQPGATNFFAVTAYDSAGAQSDYSSEVAFIVPGIIRFRTPAKNGNAAMLEFPVAPGHWYEVQATTDMHNWNTICSTTMMNTNCWNAFEDPKSKVFHSRFYRLVLH